MSLRAALRATIFGLILWAPLPFGSVGDRGAWILQTGAAMAVGLAILCWAREPETDLGAARLPLGIGAAIAVCIALQLVPWPEAIARWGSPATYELRAVTSELIGTENVASTWSLSPPNTLQALWRWLAIMGVFFASAIAFRTGRSLKPLGWTIALALAFQALYGTTEYISGHQHIFGYQKQHFLNSATGTFVNRNHFASYLAMLLPLVLAGMSARSPVREDGQSWQTWLSRTLSRDHSGRVIRLAIALSAVLAIFLSYSRGGLIATFSAVLFAAIATRRQGKQYLGWVALFAIPAVWISARELQAPGARFFSSGSESLMTLGQRLPAWRAALGLMPEHWKTGSGAGTFESVFQHVQPADVNRHWTYLHNDWLQVWLELGVFGGLLSLALAWVLGRRIVQLVESNTGRRGPWRVAVGAALIAVSVHAFWDFSSKIPGIGITIAIIAGFAFSKALDPDPKHLNYISEGRP